MTTPSKAGKADPSRIVFLEQQLRELEHREARLRATLIEASGMMKLLDRDATHPAVTEFLEKVAALLPPNTETP